MSLVAICFTACLIVAMSYYNGWITPSTDFPRISDQTRNRVTREERERNNLIFPGTKWCGSGNIADDYDDLGNFKETDSCCRDHDHCLDYIEPFSSKYNLTNNAMYSRFHCECDKKLYDCLHNSMDSLGGAVGISYFTLLNPQCFREDYPIVSCKSSSTILPRRCLEYEFDETMPKVYQWFDESYF